MQSFRLVAHPDCPPLSVTGIGVHFAPRLPDGRAMLRFRVEGHQSLVVPLFAGRGRREGLWQATCFELFARRLDGSYREFNFSPSGQWAAYGFRGYREWTQDYAPLALPEIACDRGSSMFLATVFIDARELEGFESVGISAVIEEFDETKSYWALAHGGGKPDFHDPACFAGSLAATAAR